MREGRWTKPPRNPLTLDFAKSNDPATWGSHADAVAAVEQGRAEGIGFMLDGSDIGAGDLDHCRDLHTGKIDDWANNAIKDANGAYVEVTPSGLGVRILGTAIGGGLHRKFKIPNARDGAAIETYRKANRYITVTGKQIGGDDELHDIDAVLDAIAKEFDTEPEVPKLLALQRQEQHVPPDIDDIIKNGVPKGQRSEAFNRVVWSLAARGTTPDHIQALT